jgi:ribosomal protein L33
MNKKPRHLLIFKLVALAGSITLVLGIVLAVRGFGDFESNNFMIGGFLTVFGMMATAIGIMTGFGPAIVKARLQAARYIQEEAKDDLTAIASNSAEITKDAVTTTAEAIREGIEIKKYCKHCGAKIDSDAKFCTTCGKEL